jgi:hypothetical protein
MRQFVYIFQSNLFISFKIRLLLRPRLGLDGKILDFAFSINILIANNLKFGAQIFQLILFQLTYCF